MSRRPRERARRRLLGVALVLMVLFASGGATWAATGVVRHSERRLAENEMDQWIDEATDLVHEDVGQYMEALQDVAAAIGTAAPGLTARTFAGTTASFDTHRLPGAATVSYVTVAADRNVPAAQAYWRAHGAPGLWLYRTGKDADRKFVVFGRSFTAMPPSIGRDLSQIPAADQALDRARRTGRFAISMAHISMRDRALPLTEQQVTLLMAVPVLDGSRTFRGWVTLGVHGSDFVSHILNDHLRRAVNVQLVDLDPVAVRTVVTVTGGAELREPSLYRTRALDVGQRRWRIDLQPTTTLLGQADQRLPLLVPIAGGLFTLLLTLLTAVLAGGRNRAMDRVDQATAALRHDIERRQSVEEQLRTREQELHTLAFHDQLTGLANRALFYDRVEHALRTHGRIGGRFAVFFLDLDGFKAVNDELGHGAGDQVLRETATRLTGCLGEGDTAARFGGDEFAVIVEWLSDPGGVHATADRMIAALSDPVLIGSRPVTVTVSVGVALDRPGQDADAILRAADLAMYEAKTSGKSRHVVAVA